MTTVRRSGGDGPASGARFRASDLLPIVRAALAHSGGPPAVVAWVRANGWAVAGRGRWTAADEARARRLARRLADRLSRPDGAASTAGRADVGHPTDAFRPPSPP